MNREKEIEEMAQTIAISRGYGCDNRDHCDMSCQNFKCGCIPYEYAEILYTAGYRKQSEVAKEIIGEILLNHTPDIDGFFTMHESELAKIKKKYTEESENDIQRDYTGFEMSLWR